MIIWIFVGVMVFGTNKMYLADGIEYAFVNKQDCEYAIRDSERLKCIPLELKGLPPRIIQ